MANGKLEGNEDTIRKILLSYIGIQKKGREIVNLRKVNNPKWYLNTLPPWYKRFQKAIGKRIQNKQDLWGRDWLLFCLDFAEKIAYADKNIKEKLNLFRKYLKAQKKNESLFHIKEKIKAFFWLLDSGINPEWIFIEGVWKKHRSDILVSIPLKGFINPFLSDIKRIHFMNFSIKLAIEVGSWHKQPEYLQEGIPIVWIPYRGTSVEEVLSFIKKLQTKYTFEVLSFIHYVHIIDETLSGIFFLPKPIKEVK